VDAGRLEKVTLTHKEIFERYMYAGAISRNPEAVAAMFTEDGVYEAPLIADGHRLPRRLAGRDAIRAGLSAFHRQAPPGNAPAGISFARRSASEAAPAIDLTTSPPRRVR
jgi:SnoaL-like domain